MRHGGQGEPRGVRREAARWHIGQGPARARSLAPVLGADADLLEAAAWLHDIGYAPILASTGLHQLDGARYLRDAQHADAMLCRLVATTPAPSSRPPNADSPSPELVFAPAPDVLASALTCCDMTTSPDGQPVPVEGRLAEIHDRYGPGHLVSRSIRRATPMILCAVEQVHHGPPRPHSSADGRQMSCLKTLESSTLDIPAWFMLMGRFAGSVSSRRPESRDASACSTVIASTAVVVPGPPSPTVRSRRDTSRR